MNGISSDTQSPFTGHLATAGSRVIWEAGHYYDAKGPTRWSAAGWGVLKRLAGANDARLLFIDDIHPLGNVHEAERSLENIYFEPNPEPTHIVTESSVATSAHEALDALTKLSKRKKARKSGLRWRCSGFPLTSEKGEMLCLLYDLGLTWHKRQLGFTSAVNIVPHFYEQEQRRLLRLTKKAMPDFDLKIIVHCEQGTWRFLENSDTVPAKC